MSGAAHDQGGCEGHCVGGISHRHTLDNTEHPRRTTHKQRESKRQLYPRERLQGTEIQCFFTDARPVLSAPKATTQSELRGSRVSCLGPRPSHTPARRQLVACRPPARDPSNLHSRHTPLPAALLFEMPDTSTFAFHRHTVHLTSPSSDKHQIYRQPLIIREK